MASKYFDKVLSNSSQESKVFISKTFDIVEQIGELLQKRKITQKDLSKMLGKNESEVCKWLSGSHNFTIKTLSKIETVLNDSIILTPRRFRHSFPNIEFRGLEFHIMRKQVSKRFISGTDILTCSELKVVHKKQWTSGKFENVNENQSIAS